MGEEWRGRVEVNSRVVQQQDNGVEFPPGSVIGSEGHDEVIEAVPRRLGRHDDQLVLKAVSLRVLEAVVSAALQGAHTHTRQTR